MQNEYGRVLVQLLYSSKRARKYYKLSPQRKPIGMINLLGIDNTDTLQLVWKETIGKSGTFALQSFDGRGRFSKPIGIVTVDRGKIEIKDRRCGLAAMMRRQKERRQAERKDDFVIEGGTGR